MKSKKYFIIFALTFSFGQSAFCQDSMLENPVPVAVHQRKTSRYSFPRNEQKLTATQLGNSDPLQALSNSTAYVFFTSKDEKSIEEERAAQIYNIPDACTESKIVMDEVFHDTEGSEKLDLLIYDIRNLNDAKKAGSVKAATTPWDPTYDISAGHETVDAKMQDLARVMNPQCLPARFRFVYVGAKRYQEIRYGDKAWEQ